MAKIRSKMNPPNASYFSLKVEFQTSPNKKRVETARIRDCHNTYASFALWQLVSPIFMGCRAEPPCAM
jgi:hypothetical protein